MSLVSARSCERTLSGVALWMVNPASYRGTFRTFGKFRYTVNHNVYDELVDHP
jgi:hypothetical protein